MKDLECPRVLDQEEIESTDWNEYTVEEIDYLIDCQCIKDSDIVWYYNNLQWRDRV